MIGHIPGESHLVGDDDHGGMPGGESPDYPEHFTGQFRIQCGGGLVKTENVRVQRQGTGDCDALALAAGKLMRVIVHPFSQPHIRQEGFRVRSDFLQPGGFAVFPVRLLFGQQFFSQHHVFQGGILRKEIEGLKNQTEMKTLQTDVTLKV